jgi:NADPH2:quinone reductase
VGQVRAVLLRTFGPPDVLVAEEVADPVAGPGQVLIEVAAASVVFIETRIRAGDAPTPAHRPELPVIPGNGVGGVVREIGEGVDAGLLGARVVSTTGGRGGYAELVAVDAAEPIRVPEGLDTEVATALLADGRTAVGLTRAARPGAGEWVLVEAAAGGVGTLLVQLAVAAGARVVAAAGGAAKLRYAAGAGAEVTVDYTDAGWPERVREATGGGVDVVFDGVGGDIGRAALGLVRDGGRFVVHGMAGGAMTVPSAEDAARLRVIGLGSTGDLPPRELSRLALAEAAAGRLRPTIGQTYPLEDAATAHAAIERRATVGKTLLIPGRRS